MIRRFLWLILCLVAAFIAFGLGRVSGAVSERSSSQLRTTYLATLNDLADYRTFAALSQDLAAKREAKTQCTLDLIASAKANSIRSCLKVSLCHDLIAAEVQKQAPELLQANGKLPFRYYAEHQACPPSS
jgi:hypothetical protein